MSDVLAVTQLHNRWLQSVSQRRSELVANVNNLPLVLTTLQKAVDCFYQVLLTGRLFHLSSVSPAVVK